MSRVSEEPSMLSNKFGTISGRLLIFPNRKGLFRKGSQEEIPLKEVASVNFHRQKYFTPVIASIVGVLLPFVLHALLADKFILRVTGIINASMSGDLVLKLVGFLFLAIGLGIIYLNIVGFPTVVVTTSGGKVSQARGWPWDNLEAKGFTLVLRDQIQ